jgi:hypothetical protein
MRSFHPCLTSVVSYYPIALRQVPGPLTMLLLKRSERPSDTIERLPSIVAFDVDLQAPLSASQEYAGF